jgi:hypothetical protein
MSLTRNNLARKTIGSRRKNSRRGNKATAKILRCGPGELLTLGYDARFVVGSCGRYGSGHAWVEYFQDGKCYLVESLAGRVGTLPRLSTVTYLPQFSVSWGGTVIRYFSHAKPESPLGVRIVAPLVPEYPIFWAWVGIASSYRLPKLPWTLLRRNLFRRELWLQPRARRR